jgi:hypothetical protein
MYLTLPSLSPLAFLMPSAVSKMVRSLFFSGCMVMSCVGGAMSILCGNIPEGRIILSPMRVQSAGELYYQNSFILCFWGYKPEKTSERKHL